MTVINIIIISQLCLEEKIFREIILIFIPQSMSVANSTGFNNDIKKRSNTFCYMWHWRLWECWIPMNIILKLSSFLACFPVHRENNSINCQKILDLELYVTIFLSKKLSCRIRCTVYTRTCVLPNLIPALHLTGYPLKILLKFFLDLLQV